MRFAAASAVLFLSLTTWATGVAEPPLKHPRIADFGGIATVPNAEEPPPERAKIVFDITTTSEPGAVNKGLESAARYINLHAAAGHMPENLQITVVLHGGATAIALQDAAYAKRVGAERNPNLELIRRLLGCGAEVFVCGQSLARNNFPPDEVAPEVRVAVSAMTVNVNRQQAGYSYLSIH